MGPGRMAPPGATVVEGSGLASAGHFLVRTSVDPPGLRDILDPSAKRSWSLPREVRMERFRERIVDGSASSDVETEILRLKVRHIEIEKRLTELEHHLSLTSDEQLERARLKKEKLWSKDRMAILAQQVRAA